MARQAYDVKFVFLHFQSKPIMNPEIFTIVHPFGEQKKTKKQFSGRMHPFSISLECEYSTSCIEGS